MTERTRKTRLETRLAELYSAGDPDARESKRRLDRYLGCISRFEALYGGDETGVMIVRAPGRTELGGNHTDHNGGYVLAAAVHLDCIAAVRTRTDSIVRLVSEGYAVRYEVGLDNLEPMPGEEGTITALIRGVAAATVEWGGSCGGFDAYLTSAVPSGSGLSSSAAVEVLLAAVFNWLYNEGRFDVTTLARIGRRAENRHFGKPCGLMDQLACAGGGINGIDLTDTERPRIHRVSEAFSRHGIAVVIVQTGGSHAELTEEYAAIPREMRRVAAELGGELLGDCSRDALERNLPELRRRCGDRAVLRALHFFEETERARGQYEALAAGAIAEYLTLARESGESSWKLLQNACLPGEANRQGIPLALALTERYLRRRRVERGAWRVHGGGFAGTIQVYLPIDELEGYRREIERVFGSGTAVAVRVSNIGVARVV